MSARVVVAGGGVAGLEVLIALRDMAGDLAELTLVAPEPDFVYKPLLVEEPFGLEPAEQHALNPIADQLGAAFVQKALVGVRSDQRNIALDDDSTIDYDYLVVCLGGRFRPAMNNARTFPSPEPLPIDELIGSGQISFVVPPGVTWALPIYEVALMTRRRATELGAEVALKLVTPEDAPLAIFGSTASAAVADLLAARRIDVETGVNAGDNIGGAVVALPAMDGPDLTGLPKDDNGFIPIDGYARVVGVDGVYAAGDGANFPIKQGGLATQQADAAAAHIAHALGAAVEAEPFDPILRGKLITGGESLHMRSGDERGSEASLDSLWWPSHKISGRYLAPFLYHGDTAQETEPPSGSVDVEVSLPQEWHEEPMALDPYRSPTVD